MAKQRTDANFDDFYRTCLQELQSRNDYTEAYLPMLERYVTITNKLATLNSEIVDEEVIVQHTNKADHTNQASSPKWRMFLALNSEANKLAKDLKLSPISAPRISERKKDKKGFELGGDKMKVA